MDVEEKWVAATSSELLFVIMCKDAYLQNNY